MGSAPLHQSYDAVLQSLPLRLRVTATDDIILDTNCRSGSDFVTLFSYVLPPVSIIYSLPNTDWVALSTVATTSLVVGIAVSLLPPI